MYKTYISSFILCVTLIVLSSCLSTRPGGHAETLAVVEAKKWSKVDGIITYSDWAQYQAITTYGFPGFIPSKRVKKSKYGSNPDLKTVSSGFFYTKKLNDRWWIIDPEGYACFNVAVNGVRPGGSERNEKSLIENYGTDLKWITQTHLKLEDFGFNGSACWSETPLICYSNEDNNTPLSYTMIWNFYAGFHRQRSHEKKDGISFAVFDPQFESYIDQAAKKLAETSNDPNLLGHFSDNELAFNSHILDEYCAVNDEKDPNHLAAKSWLEQSGLTQEKITDVHREVFLGVVADQYYRLVSEVIRKYDPNHMYLGSRLHAKPKHNEVIVKAAGKYADIISINYYGQWEPLSKHFDDWRSWADKPVIITEFYTKGDDSGMPNISGAGWRVKTQNDRGLFYENFCIKLLQMKNCVGWHWFRYMDNDPTDTTADQSNSNSNKGIVDNQYQYYTPLTNHMSVLNKNRYRLIHYFDKDKFDR